MKNVVTVPPSWPAGSAAASVDHPVAHIGGYNVIAGGSPPAFGPLWDVGRGAVLVDALTQEDAGRLVGELAAWLAARDLTLTTVSGPVILRRIA